MRQEKRMKLVIQISCFYPLASCFLNIVKQGGWFREEPIFLGMSAAGVSGVLTFRHCLPKSAP
jgi:hypothetical protein